MINLSPGQCFAVQFANHNLLCTISLYFMDWSYNMQCQLFIATVYQLLPFIFTFESVDI